MQVRWAAVLARVLRQYRYILKLSIPWRPLYELLVHTHLRSATGYEGAALVAVHAATVCRLVRLLRQPTCRSRAPTHTGLGMRAYADVHSCGRTALDVTLSRNQHSEHLLTNFALPHPRAFSSEERRGLHWPGRRCESAA
jgi:hypothetical protein